LKEVNNSMEWDAANSLGEFVVQSLKVETLYRAAQLDR
jgi:hypothetical protein